MIVCPEVGRTYPRITHGKGVYFFDEQGKRYLDASSGSAAVSNLGHGLPGVAEVMMEQVHKISVTPTHAFSTPALDEYLEELVNFAPPGFARAWTSTSGTEAVENAVKLALQYHQTSGDQTRYKILARWGSYHGNSVFMLDVGGMKLRRQAYAPWLNNFAHVSPAYAYRRPADMDEQAFSKHLIEELEQTILQEGPETVAAFILEPVVAAALGAVPPPQGYMEEVRRICDQYGILMIVDEVLTGFGRTGENFGINNWPVVPDIIATGKGISAGYYPLSAMIAHQKVMQPFMDTKTTFLGGHTFACNPMGAAIGKYVLGYMRQNDIIARAKTTGAIFQEKLQRLRQYEIVGDVRGVGMLAGIELVQDRLTKMPYAKGLNVSKRIGERSIENGVVLYPGKGSFDGASGDHIMITPPLIATEDHLEEIVHTMERSIHAVMEELANPN